MSRSLIAFLFLLPALAGAAVLPPRMGDFNQTGSQKFTPPEEAVYREYGLDLAEKAQYAAGDRKLEMTAIRAKDSTGAFGIYQWLRPRDGQPVERGDRAVQKGDTTIFQYGNYVLILRGASPEEDHLDALLSVLPRFERSSPPPVAKLIPQEGLVPNSERFVLGPVVLAKLAPSIPPSVAGFHLGTEAQAGEYTADGGRLTLLLFSYPTPQLARAQLEDFHKLPDVMTKRSGTLIAAIPKPFSRDEAEKLLAHVRYEATLTWSQRPQVRSENIGDFLLGIVLLCVILAGFMLLAGVGLSGMRILLARWLPGTRFDTTAESPIIRLNLSNK